MAIPLLNYSPSSQNQRVTGYEVPSDEQPRIFSADNALSSSELGYLIEAAYRQIFFHAFDSDTRTIFRVPSCGMVKLPSVILFAGYCYLIPIDVAFLT